MSLSSISPIITLTEEANKLGEIDPLTDAKIESIKADTRSRRFMVIVMALIFVGLNAAVIAMVAWAYSEDMTLLKMPNSVFKSSDRVITTQVFMSLIGATVVQVGVATIAIVTYLFPKKNGSPSAS